MYWTTRAKAHFNSLNPVNDMGINLGFDKAIEHMVTRKGRAAVQWLDVDIFFHPNSYGKKAA